MVIFSPIIKYFYNYPFTISFFKRFFLLLHTEPIDMLIRFRVANFHSFREEVEFSMISGRSKQHPNQQIFDRPEYIPPLLRCSGIFGKNASGKSNLVKAMEFGKQMITNGFRGSNPVIRQFKLDKTSKNKPSKFAFELLIKNRIYDYGFEMDNKRVLREWLIEIKRTTETIIFSREKDKITLGKIDYSSYHSSSEIPFVETIKEARLRLHFVGEDTLENQLFLTSSVERKQPYFKEIYDWFDTSLSIIMPDSKFIGTEFHLLDNKNGFMKDFEQVLKALDTDIEGLELVKLNFEKEFLKIYSDDIPELEKLLEDLDRNSQGMITMPDGKRFVINVNDDKSVECLRLMTKHRKINDSGSIPFEEPEFEYFEIYWESQGTQRLMDLIPMLFLMGNQSSTFIVDEIARSLHPEVSEKFLELIFRNPKFNKSQLIFTSHESYLMSLDLLRKDAVWFVNKKRTGESYLTSLEEFNPRFDKDIRRGYLSGRFGGIPRVDQLTLDNIFSD